MINTKETVYKNLLYFQQNIPYLYDYLRKTVNMEINNKDNFAIEALKFNDMDICIAVFEKKIIEYLSIEFSKSNVPIPVFHSGTKAHSSYYPEKESEKYTEKIKQIDKIKIADKTINKKSTIEVYGLFFLYHIPTFDRILIIDADETTFFASLLYIDYSDKFKNSKCMIILPSLVEEFEKKQDLQNALFSFYNPNNIDIIHKIYHPLYRKNYSAKQLQYDAVESKYENIVYNMMLRYKTAVFSYKRNCINSIANIKSIKKGKTYYSLDDYKCNNSKTAVIIGASPALDDKRNEIIASISQFRDKKIVISVDNGVFFCQNNAIIPDIIISLDNRSFVKKMIPNTFFAVPFICPLSINPSIFERMENPYIFALEGLPGYGDIPNINVPVSNVGLLSILFAKNCGFKNIIVWGIDFSFLNHKYYYKHTYHYVFLNMISQYFSPTIDFGTKEVLYKNEQKLFSIYKKEYDKIDNSVLRFSYENFKISDEYLKAYFKIKGYSEKLINENIKLIIDGLNVQDQNR